MAGVSINQLTLGELGLVEKKTGQTLQEFAERPTLIAMQWLAYVMKRREDPDFSESDAENLTLDQATEILAGGSDPTEAGSKKKRQSG
jgi:hypothetical protein